MHRATLLCCCCCCYSMAQKWSNRAKDVGARFLTGNGESNPLGVSYTMKMDRVDDC